MQSIHSRRTAIRNLLATAALLGFSPAANAGTTTTDPLSPFLIPAAPPLEPGPGGMEIRTLIRSAQTGMQFSCVEFAVAPMQMGPAPHYHKALDELMYVLEGTVTVMVDGQVTDVPAGSWHFRPRGIIHTFFNRTMQPARAIDMYFQQNFEDYLEEYFHVILPEMRERKLTPADPVFGKRLHELHEKFGMVGFPAQRQEWISRFGLKN